MLLSSVTGGDRKVEVPADRIDLGFVLGNLRGLENYRELFEKLSNGRGTIKVFCEIAKL